jgi:hypothetical protein
LRQVTGFSGFFGLKIEPDRRAYFVIRVGLRQELRLRLLGAGILTENRP